MLQIANILFYVSILSVLIPILFLLRRIKVFKIVVIKALGILLLASAFADFGSYGLVKMGESNIAVSNIYFVVQFFLLTYIYFLLLNNKKIIFAALISFIVFFIVNLLFIQPITEDQSWSNFVGGFILIIYSISYYHQMYKITPPIDQLRSYSFWLNTAIYFYFSFNLFLFAITNYIIKNMPADIAIISWGFHNCNNVIKNILFAVAISYVGIKHAKAYNGKEI